MLITIKMSKGYGVNTGGGNTFIIFSEPTMLSTQIATMNIGVILEATGVEQAADNRLWYKLNDNVNGGYVLGIGNTGNIYAEILDVSPPIQNITQEGLVTLTTGETFFFPQKKEEPEVPPTSDKLIMRSNMVPDSVVNSVSFTAPQKPEKVLGEVEEPIIYTEGNKIITDGLTVEGGEIQNVKIFNTFKESSELQNALRTVRKNFDFLNPDEFKLYKEHYLESFNRFKVEHPDYHLNKSFSYVFFTRPDLNIFDGNNTDVLVPELARDPTFYYLFKNNKKLLASLTKKFSSTHDLMPFLSNLATSFEISDEYIKTEEYGQTFTGYKMVYGKHNVDSKTAGTFNITYTDDKELSIYKMHKAWVEYISKVYRGEIKPKKEYIQSKILDYASSVYYIVCGPDGETILFWSKHYGIFPTSIPSSATSWTKGNMIKFPDYNINYSYSIKEDFNPFILLEFNQNTGGENGDFTYKPTFIGALGRSGTSLSGSPFIETKIDPSSGSYVFKLRFRK